jgi:tetratricopeptide (TPR) repeat protein
MDLGDCYRLLGLRSGAAFSDIKASYRRLAQQYHPDINPDDQKAKDKFIAVTEAYKMLLQVIPPDEIAQQSSRFSTSGREKSSTTQQKPLQKPPSLLEIEQQLKWKTYEQLQQFLKERQFPKAIALVEALAQRLPEDLEVRQWQAITYQIWGRALIAENQILKAKIYLNKALKTDPFNKTLWLEVQQDFQRLEQIS